MTRRCARGLCWLQPDERGTDPTGHYQPDWSYLGRKPGKGRVGRREKPLAAVRVRLQEADAKRDLSPVLAPGAFREAARLAEIIGDDVTDVKAEYVLGP